MLTRSSICSWECQWSYLAVLPSATSCQATKAPRPRSAICFLQIRRLCADPDRIRNWLDQPRRRLQTRPSITVAELIWAGREVAEAMTWAGVLPVDKGPIQDRKSTRLNSSHANISYAVFCLKKKKK